MNFRKIERRVRHGGHAIPPDTGRRRFARGLENLRHGDLGIVDEWSIHDGSKDPPRLLETGDNRPPDELMEDSGEYRTQEAPPRPVKPLDDPDFVGAEAAREFDRKTASVLGLSRTGQRRRPRIPCHLQRFR